MVVLLQRKKIVVGIKYDHHVLALDPDLVQKEKVVNIPLSTGSLVALYDEQLKTVRVFNNPDNLSFIPVANGYEDQRQNFYPYNGMADEPLMHVTYFDVMWFAWYAYYPDTEVIQ
jgi:hypothetical protein